MTEPVSCQTREIAVEYRGFPELFVGPRQQVVLGVWASRGDAGRRGLSAQGAEPRGLGYWLAIRRFGGARSAARVRAVVRG